MKPLIPAGTIFGNFTILRRGAESGKYVARCSCGVEKTVARYSLETGATKSCGCLRAAELKLRLSGPSLVGQRFERLLVQSEVETEKGLRMQCVCDCGKIVLAVRHSLIKGGTKSCGCYNRDRLAARGSTSPSLVGQRFGTYVVTREDKILVGGQLETKQFCVCDCGETVYRSKHAVLAGTKCNTCRLASEFPRGEARLHPLHSVWKGMLARVSPTSKDRANYYDRGVKICDRWKASFWDFVDDMGDRPEGSTLERKNNDGDYGPENCEWASRLQQARNQDRHGKLKKGAHLTPSGTWAACITLNPVGFGKGGKKHLGTFPTYGEAVAARLAAEKLYWK